MDAEAARWQKRLRAEFATERLVVRWNGPRERYEVLQVLHEGAVDRLDLIYCVQGEPGDLDCGEFRPLDVRTILALAARDKSLVRVPSARESVSAYRSRVAKEDARQFDHYIDMAKDSRRHVARWADANL